MHTLFCPCCASTAMSSVLRNGCLENERCTKSYFECFEACSEACLREMLMFGSLTTAVDMHLGFSRPMITSPVSQEEDSKRGMTISGILANPSDPPQGPDKHLASS